MAGREVYEFGEFTLDASERRLTKASQRIPLAPKEHDVLVALLRNAGRLVTKSELLGMVWPESFVEEGILPVHISTLRKALGDSEGRHRFIETVSRSGYRFTGAIAQRNGNAEGSSRNPAVYELIGRGRSYLLAASMFDVPKAMEAFQAAVEMDPTYAPAHAGLALACCAQAGLRLIPPAEAYSEAKAAALRALAMDPACADAQVALGAVLFFSEWNWAGAKKSLERALELNPHHTEAYVLYGQLLEALGKLEEGLETKMRALERDPHSPMVHLQVSISYWNQRRYDDAIEWANKTLELDPLHPHAREHLAGAYLKKGDAGRFFAENVKHAELHGVPAEALERLKQTFAAEGRAGMLERALQRAAKDPQAFPAMQLALFYGEAGDMDTAFQHLNRAIDSHDPSLVHLGVAPQWDRLRDDPRFTQCLVRMGLGTISVPTWSR
jgi:DNA-binding winged helix-turn-helix (wHTH) protein